MKLKYCQNCGQEIKGNFCSHCGQKTETERITFKYLRDEIFHFFTHIEHGFLFTSIRLLISPGKTIDDFIHGKRKTFQSPVSYFLIWIAAYILVLYWIDFSLGENTVINYKDYFGPRATTKFAISHLSLVLTLVIPFQALYLWLLITKNSYNYFECLVAGIYAIGTIILLQFVFAVLALLFYLVSGLSVDLKISDLFKAAYLSWFIYTFSKLFPGRLMWLRAILFILLAFGTFTLWRLYGVPELVNWILKNQ